VFVDTQIPNEADLKARFKGKNAEKRMARALKNIRPKEVDSRRLFGDWLTTTRNDRFATVIANRLWKQVFGRGVIEPVDDMKDDSIASSPELVTHLRDLMIELDFDMKAFTRVLLYTRMWRRETTSPDVGPASAKDLRGPALRRMSAEQAWDSLLTLVVDDLDVTIAPALGPRAEAIYQRYDKLRTGSDEEIMEQVGRLALRYSNPEEFRKQQRAMRQKQQQKTRALRKRLNRAKRSKDQDAVAEVIAEYRELGMRVPGPRAGRAVRDMARASDLTSPAPAGHLVRELGQSPRELIDEGHREPTVPQVLALLNSFLEQKLLTQRNSALMKRLSTARGTKEKLDSAFVSVLGRKPTASERRMWERDLKRDGAKGEQDLVWTLVNTHEFLFIQ
jgi:hypothetical protein